MTLCARGLVKCFDDARVVDGLDLDVASGEVVGLLGPNGAGKTTSLRMLAGILPPTAGSALIAGIDIHLRPLEAKPLVGFLSGDTQLYQRLSPREVLAYFGKLYSLPRPTLARRIDELISDLAMDSFCDRPCATLSAGQKQRANIARAFLHEPQLLILDEPTTALDVISGRFIVEAIRTQRARGRAILFSTHIMSEAEYLCDRIALLHQGKIIDSGSPRDLLARTGAPNLTDAFLSLIDLPSTPS